MLSDEERRSIEVERLLSVLRYVPAALSVMILNTVLVVIVLAPNGHHGRLFLWGGAVILVAGARWIFARRIVPRLQQPEPPIGRARMISVMSTGLTGILWGICGTMLFPQDPTQQFILMLIIAGMSAGSVTVSGAYLPSVAVFVLPAIVPLAASFLAEGRQWHVAGLLILIFTLLVMLVAIQAHHMFGRQLRLRLTLNRERRKLLASSKRLHAEMAQRQAAEDTLRQAQKMDAIGHLTGGIAHDFNNMLQVILGNLQLVRRAGGSNPRVVGYASAAETAALRGSELTSTLLTFARRQSLTPQAVSANRLLREFEPVLRRAVSAGIRFSMALEPGLPACSADPAYFQSAVLNLVINARDALPEGGAITVSTSADDLQAADLAGNGDARPGRFVRVSVRDTGCGMSAETLARVFEPFFSTKEPGKGTGLGLSQVFGFARQSGGHIALSSTPGSGTTASIWLPVSSTGAEPRSTQTRSAFQNA